MTFRYLLWTLAGPSQLLLLALASGAVFLWAGWRRTGRWLAGLGVAGLLAFGVLPIAAYLAAPLEHRFPQPRLPARVDGIVLLAGAERTGLSQYTGTPQVGQHSLRYVATLELARRHPDAIVVFSGGPFVEPGKGPLETQTAIAAALLPRLGIDPGRIVFETASRDTCDNAARTRALVRPRPGQHWVVVTSAMHVPRAVACFRAAGWPEVIAQPADYQAMPRFASAGAFRIVANLQLLDLGVHEWLGLAYYRISGRTREFFPSPGKS
jgi:uncharacterized SAM-binding protein YcdF (DUF218 family)